MQPTASNPLNAFLRNYAAAFRAVHRRSPRTTLFFAASVLLALSAAGVAAAVPYLLGKTIDSFHTGSVLLTLPIAYVAAWSASEILPMINNFINVGFHALAESALAEAIFARRSSAFDPRLRSVDAGAEVSAMDRANTSFADVTMTGFLVLLPVVVTSIVALTVFVSKVGVGFGCAAALGMALLLLAAVEGARRSPKYHRQGFAARDAWRGWLTDRMTQARWARIYGAQPDECRQAHVAAQAYAKERLAASWGSLRLSFVQTMAGTAFFASIAAYLMLDRSISGGDFATLTGYAIQMILPMHQTAYSLMELRKDMLALSDADLPLDDEAQSNRVAADARGWAVVEIQGFRAHDSERRLDARIEADGRLYAVRGESGSGKTCLLEALLNAFDPYAGTVTLDGVDAKAIPFERIQSQVCYVPAALLVIHGRTLRENLTWGLGRSAADAELQALLERLRLAPYHRLDDRLGRAGTTLSTGEGQRLNLARAWLRQPAWLLLDEPTANLDADSRQVVIDLIRSAKSTTIVTTHDEQLLGAAARVFHFA